jgi:hypothetical protein
VNASIENTCCIDDSATIDRIVIIKTILDSGCSILDKKIKIYPSIIKNQASSIVPPKKGLSLNPAPYTLYPAIISVAI